MYSLEVTTDDWKRIMTIGHLVRNQHIDASVGLEANTKLNGVRKYNQLLAIKVFVKANAER